MANASDRDRVVRTGPAVPMAAPEAPAPTGATHDAPAGLVNGCDAPRRVVRAGG